MERLNKIIKQSLAKRSLSLTAQAAQICFYAEKWGSGRLSAISFSKGVLKVSVNSSPAASELEMSKHDLIESVNKKLGKELVKQVRIIVKW